MPIPKELIREIRRLDPYDLRRLLMLIRGLLLAHDPAGPEHAGKITYRQESVRCGKSGCTKCPHGPYWYAYWREGGRVRSRYMGREMPEGAASP